MVGFPPGTAPEAGLQKSRSRLEGLQRMNRAMAPLAEIHDTICDRRVHHWRTKACMARAPSILETRQFPSLRRAGTGTLGRGAGAVLGICGPGGKSHWPRPSGEFAAESWPLRFPKLKIRCLCALKALTAGYDLTAGLARSLRHGSSAATCDDANLTRD